ncbi:galectin-4-like isoform X4 [Spea bombifrons]|uniref:galectin-4-like isoform X4 n=1 Tax=Spea bombifrons TaxID=233779 RepID=UPI00234BB68F|nr:galectin-4-like isoform X4 [Spea bombifrons]
MASFAPIYNPTVPFQSAILGGINEGKRVSIQGQARNQAKRFAINFVCFNNDIAFHFNPRFDEGNVIVCNTMQRNSWGSEERKSRMPFQRNTFFDIGITVLGHAFQVTVNGQFTLEYRHRVSYQTIQSLEVKGDVNLTCVTFSGSAAGPVSIHNPPMPFMAALQGTFMQNRSIIIVGFVSYGADKFGVDLLNSATRDIYLHINPRFREGALVRNTKDRGNWGPEERHVSYMPFTQGQSFQMEIRNEGGCFGVYVGGAKVFTYVHRLPVTQIDRIEVGGDVTLSYVQF